MYDGPVPWNHLGYESKPPFWHRRAQGDKAIWVRLALLDPDRK
jgi:hypothetical protein